MGNSDGQPVGNTRILAGVLGLNLAPSFHRLLHVSGCDDGARVHLTNSSLTNSAPGLGHPDKIKPGKPGYIRTPKTTSPLAFTLEDNAGILLEGQPPKPWEK